MGKLDDVKFLKGDAKEKLKEIPDEHIHTCVTSPPYFGLRDYHHDGQIGLEEGLTDYINNLVEVFLEVKRVLHPTGTLWLNIGDSYSGSGGPGGDFRDGKGGDEYGRSYDRNPKGLKGKDLCMVPERVSMALQEEGYYLRSKIIWAKAVSFNDKYSGSCMPESAQDRPTNSHEMFYLFSKFPKYFYDEKAVAEAVHNPSRIGEIRGKHKDSKRDTENANRIMKGGGEIGSTRKLRDVWTINPAQFSEAHFAVFPIELVEPSIKAGTSQYGVCSECGNPYKRVTEENVELCSGLGKSGRKPQEKHKNSIESHSGDYDIRMGPKKTTETVGWEKTCNCENSKVEKARVLDPFAGSGTTAIASLKHQRKFIGIELNEDYIDLAKKRIKNHDKVPKNHKFW